MLSLQRVLLRGTPYDSTTIFYQADLQKVRILWNKVGTDVKWGLSANFEKIKNLKYPFTAEGTFQQVSNGRNTL